MYVLDADLSINIVQRWHIMNLLIPWSRYLKLKCCEIVKKEPYNYNDDTSSRVSTIKKGRRRADAVCRRRDMKVGTARLKYSAVRICTDLTRGGHWKTRVAKNEEWKKKNPNQIQTGVLTYMTRHQLSKLSFKRGQFFTLYSENSHQSENSWV